MKFYTKIVAVLALLILIPVIVGLFLPKERLVTGKEVIDKMYFFILGDITNHWEEPQWRHNLDTMIQKPGIDGQDAWMEYYTNGDSLLLVTQKTGEKDYIRIIIDSDKRERNRNITLIDFQGKTAIRMSEEEYEPNPIKRFINLLHDKKADLINQYLRDLKEKNKPDPNAPADDGSGM